MGGLRHYVVDIPHDRRDAVRVVVDDSILCLLRRATPAEKGRFTRLKLHPKAFYPVETVVERLLIVLTRLFGFVYVKFAK